MPPLKPVITAFALALALPTQANPVARWQPYVAEASARFGIPGAWIESVIAAESGGRTTLGGRPITSHAGAMGLMQLMPATWAEMRQRWNLGSDPHNPRDNIVAGTAYLRLMYDRFGYPGMFAAYNAGPGRYEAYLAGRARLPRETSDYLAAVTGAAPKLLGGRKPSPLPRSDTRRASTEGGRMAPTSDFIFFIRRPQP